MGPRTINSFVHADLDKLDPHNLRVTMLLPEQPRIRRLMHVDRPEHEALRMAEKSSASANASARASGAAPAPAPARVSNEPMHLLRVSHARAIAEIGRMSVDAKDVLYRRVGFHQDDDVVRPFALTVGNRRGRRLHGRRTGGFQGPLESQILWGMSMDTSWRKWGQSALSASTTHRQRHSSKVKPLSTRSAASRPSGAQSQAKGRRGRRCRTAIVAVSHAGARRIATANRPSPSPTEGVVN